MQGAYDVLSDPEKRKQYDRFGSAERPRARRPGGVDFEGFDFGDLGDLGDLFGGLFGAARRAGAAAAGAAQRGADIEVEVRLSFEDSLQGRRDDDPGRGRDRLLASAAAPARSPAPRRCICPECNGRGVICREPGPVRALAAVPALPRQRHRDRGAVPDTATAPAASGARSATRSRSRPASRTARGSGCKRQGRARLRAAARPATSTSSRASRRRTLYERRGDDLVVDVPVTYPEAALGARSRCRRPDGRGLAEGPAGSEDGKLLRVRGQRRAEAEGLRPRRPPRAREADRAEEAHEGRARGDRGAPRGERMRVGVVSFLSGLALYLGGGDLAALVRPAATAAGSTRSGSRPPCSSSSACSCWSRTPCVSTGGERDRRAPALHDLRRRRARRHAPADAAHVRAEGPRAAGAHAREHAPLLGGATSSGCA